MSNLNYSIISPTGDRDDEILGTAFLKLFPKGDGAVFGVFRIPKEAARLAAITREKLERWAEREAPKPALMEASFEQIVQTINESLRDTIEEETIPIDPDNLHMAIGTISESSLAMTSNGGFRGTFLRKEKNNTFHVYDLLKGLREDSGGAEKLFASLVTGELQIDDTIALALPETIGELKDGQWKQILATMDPGEVRNHIMKTAGAIEPVLIVRTTEKPVHTPEAKHESVRSIEALRNTERTTAQFLHGRALPNLGVFKSIFKNITEQIQQTRNRGVQKIKHISFRSIIRLPIVIVYGVVRAVRFVIQMIFKKQEGQRRRPHYEIREAYDRIRNFSISRFNALPKRSRFLFIIIIVVVVLFIQSIVYLGYQNKIKKQATAYNDVAATIQKLQDDADASIIYRDEEGARALLMQARAEATALPQKSRKERNATKALLQKIETSLVALRHEIVVEPTVVAESPTDLSAGAFDAWFKAYSDLVQTITSYEGRTVGLGQDGSLFFFTSDDVLAPFSVNLPREPITDAELFGDRLYVYVESAQQIYRLRRSGNSFDSASPWVTEGAEGLVGTRSIGIDGALYALKANEIIKYFTGVRETWTPYIDPPLEDATRVWTSDEVDNIYILEPSKRRVIVLDKPGALIAQYIFPEGSNLRDFSIDEKNRVLSVLDGTQVKHVELSHLIGSND